MTLSYLCGLRLHPLDSFGPGGPPEAEFWKAVLSRSPYPVSLISFSCLLGTLLIFEGVRACEEQPSPASPSPCRKSANGKMRVDS